MAKIRKVSVCKCGHSEKVHYPKGGCLLCSCEGLDSVVVQIIWKPLVEGWTLSGTKRPLAKVLKVSPPSQGKAVQ